MTDVIRTDYRVTYPVVADGTMEDELEDRTFQTEDDCQWFLVYLRQRNVPYRVEYRQWTPTEWKVLSDD